MKSKWRAVLFITCLVLALVGGLWLKGQSTAPRSHLPEGTNDDILLYVTNPDIKLDVKLEVHPSFDQKTRQRSFVADLQVDPRTMKDLLITSSIKGKTFGDDRFNVLRPEPAPSPLPAGSVQVTGLRPNYVYVPPDLGKIARGPYVDVAMFPLPNDSVTVSRGTFSAELPRIAPAEDLEGNDFPLLSVYHAKGPDAQAYAISLDHLPKPRSRNPADYGITNPAGQQLYWAPTDLTAKVQIDNAIQYIRDARIDTNLPSNGVAVGDDFVWTGGFGLAPSFAATKLEAVENRSSDEFYSGLLLGLASAALLALFVELPEKLELRRKARALLAKMPRHKATQRTSGLPIPPE